MQKHHNIYAACRRTSIILAVAVCFVRSSFEVKRPFGGLFRRFRATRGVFRAIRFLRVVIGT